MFDSLPDFNGNDLSMGSTHPTVTNNLVCIEIEYARTNKY